MNIDNTFQGIRALPALTKEEPVIFSDITNIPLSDDDVAFISAKVSDSLENGFNFQGIDRRYRLMAVDKSGGLVEDIEIGENFTTLTHVNWILQNGASRPAPQLSLQPAVAAAAVDAIDRNYVQAIAAVNTLFTSGNEPKMSSRDIHWVRRCVSTRGDPTRLFFRLAQMYYYYRQLESQSCLTRPTPSTANPTHINSVAGIISTLKSAAAGVHFLPFDLDIYSGDAATAVTILRFVAEGTSWMSMPGIELSSILLMPVTMPDVQVILTGSSAPSVVNPNFHSSEIWDVMFSLAGQIDCVDIAKEMLSVVAGQLYGPKPDEDPVFRSQHVRFALPPLNMCYYGIFPIALAADAITQPVFPDEGEMHAQACMLVLRAQLLSVAYREVLWGLGLNGKYSSARHAARAAKWRRNLLTRNRRPYAPIIGIMLEYLTKNQCTVSMSVTSATFVPDAVSISGLSLNDAMSKCSAWIDVLDVVPSAPMAALDAYINPKKSTNLMQPGVRYKLDKVSPSSLPSNVAALQAHGATFEVIHKLKTDLNWSVSPLTLLPTKYGIPSDRPFPNFTVDDLTTAHITVRLPDAAAALGMFHNDQKRKDWTWYINGTGDKPTGDPFDDDPFAGSGPVDVGDSGLGPPSNVNPGGGGGGDAPGWDPSSNEDGGGQDTMHDSGTDATPGRVADEVITLLKTAVRDNTTTQAKSAPQVGELPKLEKWTYDDLRLAATGVLHQAAHAYRDAVLAQDNQPGRDIYTHMEPLITPVANNMENISLVAAVEGVDPSKRVAVMNACARVMQKLASNTRDPVTAKKLCVAAQRALNAAKALKVCPCVNTAELAESGLGWNSTADMLLKVTATDLVEHGISLSEFTGPRSVGVESKQVEVDDVRSMEEDGWRRSQKQEGATAGMVKMYRPKKAVYPTVDWDGASMLISEAAEEMRARAEALLNSLSQSIADLGKRDEEATEVKNEQNKVVPSTDSVSDQERMESGTPPERVFALPSGLEEEARKKEAWRKARNKEKSEYAVARENVENQIRHFLAKEKDYNDPLRKDYVQSKRLALEMALEDGRTADELADAMIQAIGQPNADFGRAGAPEAATLVGSLEQPKYTEDAASDVGLEEDEDALGPPPRPSTPTTPSGSLNPDALPDLETI